LISVFYKLLSDIITCNLSFFAICKFSFKFHAQFSFIVVCLSLAELILFPFIYIYKILLEFRSYTSSNIILLYNSIEKIPVPKKCSNRLQFIFFYKRLYWCKFLIYSMSMTDSLKISNTHTHRQSWFGYHSQAQDWLTLRECWDWGVIIITCKLRFLFNVFYKMWTKIRSQCNRYSFIKFLLLLVNNKTKP
jgi:hypothetical protein